ncbi:aminotransferase-like domain-containing protein [Actinomadura rubteroloni]|uniref:aminotransferase-like domain-containing protein n=1 Tax=Actinomadura rubteroloni TaxID=1926885 RepID=UPI000CD8C2FC|nr:PLP-dependent aminotransferase family protein [Actinomadura rubteroloni]
MKNDSSGASLAAALRVEIRALRPGARLPSSRALMERHRVSPVTVTRAIGQLAAEGLVVTRPGSGAFVAERPRPRADPPDFGWQAVALGDRTVDASTVRELVSPVPDGMIRLSGGYLHASLQPSRALATAMGRAARRPDAWEAPPPAGLAGLRTWFARATGPDLTPDDVTVTGGGQQSLATVLRALLPPGSPLLVESPTYPGVLALARTIGLQPVPVPVDADGLRPDLLAEAFGVTGARAVYCQPTLHNPTGAVMPSARRERVLAVARAAGAFVVEDDYARHFVTEPVPPPLVTADTEGRVVHIASLTKVTAPSVRIAGVIARGPVAERIRSAQLVTDFFPARPLQEAVLELVGSPGWTRHLAAVGTALTARRDALLTAVARELGAAPRRPSGGLHAWVPLPAGTDDRAVAEAAARAGVRVSAGRPYFPAEADGPHARLSWGAAASEAEIAEGVRRFAGVLA